MGGIFSSHREESREDFSNGQGSEGGFDMAIVKAKDLVASNPVMVFRSLLPLSLFSSSFNRSRVCAFLTLAYWIGTKLSK